MPTNPLTAPTRTTTTAATIGAAATGSATQSRSAILGKDDFLKLLIGQMQNQDPLNPSDPAAQMGQLTQFSILEQLTNLGETTEATSANQYDAQAVGLIGRTVTYLSADDPANPRSVTGVVDSVTFTSNGPSLTIDGVRGITPVAVTEVR